MTAPILKSLYTVTLCSQKKKYQDTDIPEVVAGAPTQARWSGQKDEDGRGGRRLFDPARSALENSEEMLGFELKGAQLCTVLSIVGFI